MNIGGYQPFSLSDYPGCPAAIVFTQGCNFRCPFCHNASLVLRPGEGAELPEASFLRSCAKERACSTACA